MGLETNIEQAAQEPAKASGDSGSVEQHNLKDMVEADRYLASKTAMGTKKCIGIKLMKISPAGTV